MDVVLLLDALGHQLALLYAELFRAAHHLALLVLVHPDVVAGVDDAVAAQHLAYGNASTAEGLGLRLDLSGEKRLRAAPLTQVLPLVDDGLGLAERQGVVLIGQLGA